MKQKIITIVVTAIISIAITMIMSKRINIQEQDPAEGQKAKIKRLEQRNTRLEQSLDRMYDHADSLKKRILSLEIRIQANKAQLDSLNETYYENIDSLNSLDAYGNIAVWSKYTDPRK